MFRVVVGLEGPPLDERAEGHTDQTEVGVGRRYPVQASNVPPDSDIHRQHHAQGAHQARHEGRDQPSKRHAQNERNERENTREKRVTFEIHVESCTCFDQVGDCLLYTSDAADDA